MKQKYGIEVTPLSQIPGARIESYKGNLNFFFIRESTSIREVCNDSIIVNFIHENIASVC